MEHCIVTPQGKIDMENRLRHLIDVKRPKIIKDIEEARAHGDLSENSEYHDARERQSLNEGAIKDLEGKISRSLVINIEDYEPLSQQERIVMFGCTVKLERKEGRKKVREVFKIVGEDEAQSNDKKISYLSPLAQALIEQDEGELVTIGNDENQQQYEIIEITYKKEDPV